ncbi:hypothetical protein [Aliamphritea spongicola]|nr:hypothetical protein [Aliamphritea spongicola]
MYTLPALSAPTVYIPLGSGNGVVAVDAATDTVTEHFTGLKIPTGWWPLPMVNSCWRAALLRTKKNRRR